MKKQLSKQSGRPHKTDSWGLIVLLLVFLWLFLAGCQGLSAQTINIMPIGANYGDKTVTFRVSWNGTFIPNDRVWVWIDYCPVEDVTPAGTFGPARIDAVTPLDKVDHITLRGFFVTSSPAEVTVTLGDASGAFNWCAYGSAAPPQAVLVTGGGYELKGTPPFVVNGSALGAGVKTFGAGTCITSLTDATGNPTSILPDPPSITLSAGSSSQTATENTALPALQYTTANASGASLASGSFPAGVTGSWANNTYPISGMPTATGTFTYTVATTNSQSCTNASENGTITVSPANAYASCITASLVLGTVGFASSDTYSRNGLTISPPVTVTYCAGRSALAFDAGSSGSYKADCAKNNYSTTYGDWISGCMVAQYASTLCPTPWRVPTNEDFCLIVNGDRNVCTAKQNSDVALVGFGSYGGFASTQGSQNPNIGLWVGYSSLTPTGIAGISNFVTYASPTNLDASCGYMLRCVQ